MIPGNTPQEFFGAAAAAAGAAATAGRSVRFNSADSAYLHRDFSSGNRQTWTWSGWIKRAKLGTQTAVFMSSDNPVSNTEGIRFFDDKLELFVFASGSYFNLRSADVFRDPSAWYHCVVVADLSNATQSERMRLYVNGRRIDSFSVNSIPSNTSTQFSFINNSQRVFLSRSDVSGGYYADHYLALVHFIDGYAYDPSYFGETSATTGQWIAKTYSGSYGTNGFFLDFLDNSTAAALGYDAAGSNDWTVNNISPGSSVSYTARTSLTAGTFYSGRGTISKIYDGIIGANGSPFKFLEFDTHPATLTFSPAITSSSGNVKMYVASYYGASSYSATLNGSTSYSFTSVPAEGTPAVLYDLGVTTLSSITFPTGGAPAMRVFGIVADNVLLIDGAAGDSLRDHPTSAGTSTGAGGEVAGNYCTWNPLAKNSIYFGTLSNGNLESAASGDSRAAYGTIAIPSSGKWYFEVTTTGSPAAPYVGVAAYGASSAYPQDSYSPSLTYYGADGTKDIEGTYTSYGASYSNATIGVAVNVDSSQVTFYKDGASQGAISKSVVGAFPFVSTAGGSGTFTANFGQRAFAYSAPSGFSPLVDTLLPTPTIAKPNTVMDVKLYTGNGSSQSITGLGFSPDLVWIKGRSGATDHALYDVVRGAEKRLESNNTDAEVTSDGGVTAFNSDGFSLGTLAQVNTNSASYVGWTWDAGANSSKTYTVTVVSGAFYIDGKQQPTLNLEEGSTYTFDLSAASNSGHPLRLSTTVDGPSQYTTGVTTSGTAGNAGATLTIAVASGAPTLYYFCTNHNGMGGQINTNTTAGASNFAGTITSTVRANISAGLSVVTYTGNGTTNGSVGHGLGVAPAFVIAKTRSKADAWNCYHTSLGNAKPIVLNSTNAAAISDTAVWGTNAGPTSSVFYVNYPGSPVYTNENGTTYVAYCFAPVAGYSAFGSFTGNGSSDGPFVYTGFRPRWLLYKCSSTGGDWWNFVDTARATYNVVGPYLESGSQAESTGSVIDILSNGFKLRFGLGNQWNGSGQTYVYACFAEAPFPYARAR